MLIIISCSFLINKATFLWGRLWSFSLSQWRQCSPVKQKIMTFVVPVLILVIGESQSARLLVPPQSFPLCCQARGLKFSLTGAQSRIPAKTQAALTTVNSSYVLSGGQRTRYLCLTPHPTRLRFNFPSFPTKMSLIDVQCVSKWMFLRYSREKPKENDVFATYLICYNVTKMHCHNFAFTRLKNAFKKWFASTSLHVIHPPTFTGYLQVLADLLRLF